MKEGATQLRTTTYTGPQGPVIPYRIPIDDLGNELPMGHGGRRLKRPRCRQRHEPYAQGEEVAQQEEGQPMDEAQ